ncbi:30S ribosomal protein S21 [Lyngbya confervoides]|uniref:Small ribosomal subunit protein bS21 n=1 Tax=Lyngbya confervoides BDU141951 TaxID=1574623 RepID=A0ABD4T0G7_9CYAN|nr:30S ribosomal protein S21 [Lyngbya confervoides]MCM1982266.1 30S ribosomal protein S21 [Lyngbya confervoides BDU141951]
MAQIVLSRDEGIDSALYRFKRKVVVAGIFSDMRKNRHFETPIEKRKRKLLARQKRRRHQKFR